MTARTSRRPAFTLLEVLLATFIGVMLLSALYVAVDMQLRNTEAGRNCIERGTLSRSLLARIQSDVATSLAPYDPTATTPSSSQQGGGASGGGMGGGGASSPSGSGATGSGATGSGATGSGATGSGSSRATGSSGVTGGTTNLNGPVTFNLGIQGDPTHLTVYASRVPRELDPSVIGVNADPSTLPVVSDLRRITYWLSSSPPGLARQEVKISTSMDALGVPEVADDPSYLIAEEVQSLQFQYWDGANWNDTWDGTDTSLDPNGIKPKGPPLAIAVTIGVVMPGGATTDGQPTVKFYRHVIAITTANGQAQQLQLAPGSSQ